jgi:DMSO/TMAO reductase YedYZ molybdopterin-dependent catalytic subunit
MLKNKLVLTILILMLAASACTPADQAAPPAANSTILLKVSGGADSLTYSRADLEKMPVTKARFQDIAYIGVAVKSLLQQAGFDPAQVKAVKAVAADGFTVNYDSSSFLREDMIVAYAAENGPLSDQDGAFRIVLPGAEGKLNPRMLVELQVIP